MILSQMNRVAARVEHAHVSAMLIEATCFVRADEACVRPTRRRRRIQRPWRR
jgi:hypothetical protein